jgi:hypothetical protein
MVAYDLRSRGTPARGPMTIPVLAPEPGGSAARRAVVLAQCALAHARKDCGRRPVYNDVIYGQNFGGRIHNGDCIYPAPAPAPGYETSEQR